MFPPLRITPMRCILSQPGVSTIFLDKAAATATAPLGSTTTCRAYSILDLMKQAVLRKEQSFLGMALQ